MVFTSVTCASWKALVYLVSLNRSKNSNKDQVHSPRWQEMMCLVPCGLSAFFISEHSRRLSNGRALPECQGTWQDLEQLCSSAVRASPPTWDMYVSHAGSASGISLLPGTLHQEFPDFMGQQTAVDPQMSLLFR